MFSTNSFDVTFCKYIVYLETLIIFIITLTQRMPVWAVSSWCMIELKMTLPFKTVLCIVLPLIVYYLSNTSSSVGYRSCRLLVYRSVWCPLNTTTSTSMLSLLLHLHFVLTFVQTWRYKFGWNKCRPNFTILNMKCTFGCITLLQVLNTYS